MLVHEKCDKLPSQLEQKSILNRAVGHTNVKLTWEEVLYWIGGYDTKKSKNRTKFWHGKKQEEWSRMDWSELVAGFNDEADDEGQFEMEESYQKKKKHASELEITFRSGFHDGGNEILLKREGKKNARKKDAKDYFVGFDKEEGERQPFRESEGGYVLRC